MVAWGERDSQSTLCLVAARTGIRIRVQARLCMSQQLARLPLSLSPVRLAPDLDLCKAFTARQLAAARAFVVVIKHSAAPIQLVLWDADP